MRISQQIVRRTAATASLVLAVGAMTTLPAAASSGGGVERSGSCSHSAHWKLSAKGDNGRIEVEGEVDSNAAGQHWTWRIQHNGGVSAHGAATTKGSSGSFTIRRVLVDAAGVDAIGWRATNTASGETCSGNLQF